jgi:hypothetical protein
VKRSDGSTSALVRLTEVLGRWFEALYPRDLTKNQRFSLACCLIAVLLSVVSLFAPLDGQQYFVLFLAILAFLAWCRYTNLRS